MKTRIKNLLLLLLLLGLPAVVQAQDAYSTNADGSIYTYSTNDDGSANIVAYAGPPWVVTIPTNINGLTVTTIGYGAFYGTALTSVTIPNSVTSVGQSAFAYCSGLTSVTIGNSVTSIGAAAFNECTSLTNVTIPGSVTSIGEEAFLRCASLRSVIIPNSVTSIGQSAFAGCTSLTSVYFTGNAPSPTDDSSVFYGNYYDPVTAYYLPGTTGWGATFDSIPTAPWFLPNLTVRLFTRRFTRCTLGYSKKVSNLQHAVALFVAHYNFCRVHSAHKLTPAVSCGLADRIWTISELLAAPI